MIKQLLNSVNAKYHDLSVSRRSIIYLSLLATDKSWYFAQPPPIIVNYFIMHKLCSSSQQWHWRELYRSNKKGSSQFKLRANEIHVCFFSFLHSNINNNEHHYYQCDISKNGNIISWRWREQACELSSQEPLAECIMLFLVKYAVSPPFHGNFATLNLLFFITQGQSLWGYVQTEIIVYPWNNKGAEQTRNFCMDLIVYVVVQFNPWFKFYFPLF